MTDSSVARARLTRVLGPIAGAVGGLWLLLAISSAAGIADLTPGLLAHVQQRWGNSGRDRVQSWHDFVVREQKAATPATPKGALALAEATNDFWNDITYQEDAATWGDDNFMPTPIETLGANRADCKAYAIGKYFTLRALGFPVSQLRITYVRVRDLDAPHMVLAYYPTPDADPYILDNLDHDISRASDRDDLEPVYSFNDDDLWAAGSGPRVGNASQIRVWRDLQQRLARERQY